MCLFNACEKGFTGHIDELLRFIGNFSDTPGSRRVTDIAVKRRAEIDGDDVSFFQYSV